MKKQIFAAFLTVVLLFVTTGCDTRNTPASEPEESSTDRDGPATLWVLVNSKSRSVNKNALSNRVGELAEEYSASREKVNIKVEYLPSEAEELETRLDQLRTLIMAGQGPDIYILPTGQLFGDVEQSMRNGMFADISTLYDTDDELGKGELEQTVMDAGTVDGTRYVLPLRYTFPAVYIDASQLDSLGLDVERMRESADGLLDEIAAKADPALAKYAWPMFYHNAFCVFPNTLDYDRQSVALTEDEVEEYLERVQKVRVLAAQDISIPEFPSIGSYIGTTLVMGGSEPDATEPSFPLGNESSPYTGGFPIYVGSLENSLDVVSVGKAAGMDVAMFPMKSTDGSLVANITYWGAVGANCAYPELAYDFLRQTLMKDFQWETGQGKTVTEGNLTAYPEYGLCASGWPVRSVGSAEALWELYGRELRANLSNKTADATDRIVELKNVEITQADIPLLDYQIDRVRFYISEEGGFYSAILSLNANTDIHSLLEEVISELQYHLAEG